MVDQNLNDMQAAANQVSIMLNSNAWKDYIGPLLDTMIVDTLGGKQSDRWLDSPPGLDETNITNEHFRYLLGYKAGLIEFHNKVHSFIDTYDSAREMQDLQQANKNPYDEIFQESDK